eukprot:11202105-Lingulodinium_polyedra.AAC.1
MVHRTPKGAGNRAMRANRPTAPRTRAAATGARLAGPACATTPRSLNVVDAGTPPPSDASHRRRPA